MSEVVEVSSNISNESDIVATPIAEVKQEAAAPVEPAKLKKRNYTMTDGRKMALEKANEARIANKLKRQAELEEASSTKRQEDDQLFEDRIMSIVRKHDKPTPKPVTPEPTRQVPPPPAPKPAYIQPAIDPRVERMLAMITGKN